MIIGIVGMGCVGKAMCQSFKLKGINIICYDINNNYDKLEDILLMS